MGRKLPNLVTLRNSCFRENHRHLRKIDGLMACTACQVCLISTVNGHSKKKRKRLKSGAGSGHITDLKQSSFSFDSYGAN
jgi:hypothetical protein